MVEKGVIVDISPVQSSPLLDSMATIFGAMTTIDVPSDMDMRSARNAADQQLQKTITNNETRGFVMLNFVKHPDGRCAQLYSFFFFDTNPFIFDA